MSDVKQVIVIRKDLKMRRGKEMAQAAHASSKWLLNTFFNKHDNSNDHFLRDVVDSDLTPAQWTWVSGQFTKVVLQVSSEAELIGLYALAQEAGLEVNMITDAGATEFHGIPTKTCLAIGPAESSEIDKITSHLKLY